MTLAKLPVFLGYLDTLVSVEAKSFPKSFINRTGGTPDWIVGPPRDVGRVKKCQTCSGNLSLLCQLSTSYDEGKLRVVYIFVCSDGKCSENDRSWIALRYNGKTENTSLTTSASPSTVASLHAPASFNQAPLTLDIPVLDGDKDDWLSLAYQDAAVASSSCRPSEEEQIFSALPVPAQSDAASSVAPNDSLTQNGCDPPISEIESSGGFQFPSAYISVQREPEAVLDYYEDSLDRRARELRMMYEKRKAEGSETHEDATDSKAVAGVGGFAPEDYELHKEETFLKFQERIRRSPLQVIRYSFGGVPLWISDPATTKPSTMSLPPPKCERCKGPRVFELQLMPTLYDQLRRYDVFSTLCLFAHPMVAICPPRSNVVHR
eukprot:GHVT01025681.1.p1 GENE.GHVT01025681.1~~GHVT01025681.1.p1  ORF type:complete len:377 (-),score=19.00 GHVT01025681.1:277-1407(-)